MRRRLSRLAALLLPVALVAGALTVAFDVAVPAQKATAADASLFQAGNIISDQAFNDTGTMSAAQIQAFLASKVTTCTSGRTCLKDYRQTTSTRAANAYCSKYTGAASETAATILSKVSKACGINPQVLLVTLQKEEGLVTSTGPSSGAYTIATGFACPDTAACDSRYYGFFNQLYSAARQFQVYAKNPMSFRYRSGVNNIIQYSPSAACGSASVYIQNQATASLYNYTPYTPNAASLAAGYGSASCGAYGNRNFYLYFADWFGNPSNWFKSSSFEGGSVAGWTRSVGTSNRSIAVDPAHAQSGIDYMVINTQQKGSALTQDVTRTTRVGEQAIASVWVRSATATPFSGRLSLWGLGGTTEQAVTNFSVTGTWTLVTVTLPVRTSDHGTIRLDINMNTTGANLWVDNTSLTFGTAPVLQNKLANPSFEGSFAGWGPGNGAMNQQIYKQTTARQGSWFAAANTPVAGRSFSQTVKQSTASGQRWTFSVYLRSSTSKPFTGSLALWGLGGSSNIRSTVPFTVGSTWTKVETTLDIGAIRPSQLKAEVYLSTTAATASLWLDQASVSNNLLTAGSFEAGQTTGWNRAVSTMNLVSYPASATAVTAQNGVSLGATNTPKAAYSISQSRTMAPAPGETYSAEIWVRSASGAAFKGRLALWALGGTTEATSTSFTAGATWQRVAIELPIAKTGHTSLKFEVYEDTVGSTLFLDGAQLH
ncbi:hypothetical protein GCM10025867_37570 [Frondihabitans sucicola]|uniref:CBM-cenC domain-containing protein n=1 Tax=Frondihabitans sucicola TaxID=1268041 RepID=A0ABM8GSS2_9MICO|nr:hypothetical protein [Frondihabitans sucicola]BDZ51516.1 hypothetical protein GCM10025867_37570 [Frondihabitans sucicola]